jgi:HD-like signal output (HDOD) protein
MVLLWNLNADLSDFITVIESDPGLTAGIVRAANAAYSAPLEPVTSCRDAVVHVGLNASQQITVAAMVRAEFDRLEESDIDVIEMWRWQLAVGLLTETFAADDHLEPLLR